MGCRVDSMWTRIQVVQESETLDELQKAPRDTDAAIADNEVSARPAEPPKIYIPACGVLCDIFWWARR